MSDPKATPAATDEEIARVVGQAIRHGLNASWDRDTILPMAARIEADRQKIAGAKEREDFLKVQVDDLSNQLSKSSARRSPPWRRASRNWRAG